MTRRKDELRHRSYDELMHDAGDRMDEDAIRAVGKCQAIRAKGHTPEILWSPHHGWVIRDPSPTPGGGDRGP
jgi:hypothetical protein